MRTTSSQRPNLRPTSRSPPISSKPHLRCSAIDASWPPTIRAITEWKPWSVPSAAGSRAAAARRRPGPGASRCTYTESSTVGAYAARGLNGESDAKPSTVVVVVDRDDRRMAARVLVDPLPLVGERARHEVERDRRLEDLDVVDRAHRLGVARLDESGPHGAHATRRSATEGPSTDGAGPRGLG